MKIKDIVIGETYAVGRGNYKNKARAVEVGPMVRRVWSGRWSDRKTLPSVKVERLNRDGEVEGTEILAPQQVHSTWADYEKQREQENELRARREERSRNERNLAVQIAKALDEKLGLKDGTFEVGYSSSSYEVRIPQYQFKKLVETLGIEVES